MQQMPYPWTYAVASLFLLAGAVLGSWLRYGLVFGAPFPAPYLNMLHSHSHVLFFGWITLALGALLRPDDRCFHKLLAPLSALGALVALAMFWQFGYTAPAIAASSLFLLPWGYLAYHGLRAYRGLPGEHGFLGASAFSLILAIAATLGLPLMVALGGAMHFKGFLVSAFLHFLIDGWIFLGLLSLLSRRSPAAGLVWIYLLALTVAPLAETTTASQSFGLAARAVVGGLQLVWILRERSCFSSPLLRVALVAGVTRSLADIASAVVMVPLSRELIIAHIHARTLAFASCASVALIFARLPRHEGLLITLTLGCGSLAMLAGLVYAGTSPYLLANSIRHIRFGQITALYASLLTTAGALIIAAFLTLFALRRGVQCSE